MMHRIAMYLIVLLLAAPVSAAAPTQQSTPAQTPAVCPDGLHQGAYYAEHDAYIVPDGGNTRGNLWVTLDVTKMDPTAWPRFNELNGDMPVEDLPDGRKRVLTHPCDHLKGLRNLGFTVVEETERVVASPPKIVQAKFLGLGLPWWLALLAIAIAGVIYLIVRKQRLQEDVANRTAERDHAKIVGDHARLAAQDFREPTRRPLAEYTWTRPSNASPGPSFYEEGITAGNVEAAMAPGAAFVAQAMGITIPPGQRPQLVRSEEGRCTGEYFTCYPDRSRQRREVAITNPAPMWRGLFMIPGRDQPVWIYYDQACGNPVTVEGASIEAGRNFRWWLVTEADRQREAAARREEAALRAARAAATGAAMQAQEVTRSVEAEQPEPAAETPQFAAINISPTEDGRLVAQIDGREVASGDSLRIRQMAEGQSAEAFQGVRIGGDIYLIAENDEVPEAEGLPDEDSNKRLLAEAERGNREADPAIEIDWAGEGLPTEVTSRGQGEPGAAIRDLTQGPPELTVEDGGAAEPEQAADELPRIEAADASNEDPPLNEEERNRRDIAG